jgi:hypothetical protein
MNMVDLGDRPSDDSSSILSLPLSQYGSSSSGSLTNLSHAGGGANLVTARNLRLGQNAVP